MSKNIADFFSMFKIIFIVVVAASVVQEIDAMPAFTTVFLGNGPRFCRGLTQIFLLS
jgi:hypothetical protein